ncbi:MAG TPA: hypothetical protein VMB84_07470 [Stellaceae bacterium]|nr:hypothetical protein [Stellaceae bacterium]
MLDAYAAPNQSFEEARKQLASEDFDDPLRAFADACRAELAALRA